MPNDPSFDDLLVRLRAADEAAVRLIVNQYTRRLVGVARANLDHRFQGKEDPEDVLQSVFKSFFFRCGLGQFQLDNRNDLWALLVGLTLHKCGHRADYFRAARRDVQREVPAPRQPDSRTHGCEALDREPTPLEAAMLVETIQRLLDGLEPRQKEIVQLSLQGQAPPEIAEHVGVTLRTVQRVLKGVRERLERWRQEGDKEA